MISDLQTTACGTIVPQDRSDMVRAAFDGLAGTVQPVRDVAKYLGERGPQPDIAGEECLIITLGAKVQAETRALVKACKYALGLVKARWSVQAACKNAVGVYRRWNWKLNTFRPKFDEWVAKMDWVVLVNLSKAPASWRSISAGVGLPAEFLAHAETKLGGFGRRDGKRQAVLSLHRHWRTGKDEFGVACPVPGYEVLADATPWKERDRENLPNGWSYDNILDQVKQRARFTPATRAMLHEGESAARQFLPQNLGTRKNLRFLEKVTFDDVRLDWLVFNPATGQAEELWLLVARDEATAMVLGFVMHPATVREDGSASHLGARQMKELAAYLLERYPLPPYLVHWVVERGTATLAEAVKAALAELFNDRIKVHYTSMIGDKSPVGYKEKKKGNSRGKASHEAHNRLFHTAGSFLPGQTGADWSIRPADLEARVKECREIHELALRLPEDKRGEVKYTLLTLAQSRVEIEKLCQNQNFRDAHKLEGFDEILVKDAAGQIRQRVEMPVERAAKLIKAVDHWDRVSPEIIRTFLEHTQRMVTVNDKGEIKIEVEGRSFYFHHAGNPLNPDTKALAYHHPADPQFLHLTTGDGRILGTWTQRGRGAFLDQQALAEAMRYMHAARAAAQDIAADLAAPKRQQLEEIRAHNAALEKFIVTAEIPGATARLDTGAVAASLDAIKATAQAQKSADRAEAAFVKRHGAAAAEDILAGDNSTGKLSSAGDDLLGALT